MFARKVHITHNGQPCPLKWLDNFAMRNFTNDAVFDDTLPAADGVLEIGARVPLDALKSAMEDWFRKKGYLGKDESLHLTESA
ncbi:MAG TPA: hypothetical protein VMZ25_04315 [Terriglobales bacterium]|nr:hypothetical protein [Terriglobales bacterium]